MHALMLRALKGRSVSLKALQVSETEMRELLEGMEDNSGLSMRGHLFALLGQLMIFTNLPR